MSFPLLQCKLRLLKGTLRLALTMDKLASQATMALTLIYYGQKLQSDLQETSETFATTKANQVPHSYATCPRDRVYLPKRVTLFNAYKVFSLFILPS
jgi:hypothetical protein